MKRIILIAAALGLLATNALAETSITRMDSSTMTCEAVQSRLKQDGTAVLRYPSQKVPGMMMYNRYVASNTPCVGQGVMASSSVPTSDNPKCKVKMCGSNTGKGAVKGGGSKNK
jgi:hypothetical protein